MGPTAICALVKLSNCPSSPVVSGDNRSMKSRSAAASTDSTSSRLSERATEEMGLGWTSASESFSEDSYSDISSLAPSRKGDCRGKRLFVCILLFTPCGDGDATERSFPESRSDIVASIDPAPFFSLEPDLPEVTLSMLRLLRRGRAEPYISSSSSDNFRSRWELLKSICVLTTLSGCCSGVNSLSGCVSLCDSMTARTCEPVLC